MNTNKSFTVITIVTLLLGACRPTSPPTPFIPDTGSLHESIGVLSAEETLVESGPSDNLIQVTKTEDFFNNYTVRVTNGGVAKLDFFVNQISIRLFNDTAVGNVRADPSGTPDRAVRMKLVFGGLSGEVSKNGIPVQFEITNGVNVYILGTQFLVLYDPENSTTYIGNFDGTIAYTTPGQPAVQFIQAGQLYEISPSFETRTRILTFTRTDLETLTSDRRSTLLVTLQEYLSPTATPTATTTSTPFPTSTSTSTPTPIPTSTLTPTKVTPCNKAAFVADVTVPDGTSFMPGFQFTKVWRLKNMGTCTWTTSYSLVFYKGEQMGGLSSVNLPSAVAPGQTVDLEVGLVAPSLPGTYRGDWMLQNASGTIFGGGANGTTPIWVMINVMELPDLTVMISADPSADCPTSKTCTTTIELVITNTSTVDVTNSFQVLIEVNDIPSQTITVDGLAAGTNQSVSETLTGFCYNPDCTVRLTVDSSNIIPESSEANNVAEEMFNG